MTKRILNTITEYVEPSDVFTEAEQMDQCCEQVSADPCVEVGRVEPYVSADIAGLDLEKLLNEARAAHPGVKIVGVQVVDKGPSGDCGTMYTEWAGREKCCDFVDQIVVDDATSVDVLADNSSGVIGIAGGRAPFSVSVRGNGFWLDADHTFRDGTVSDETVRIYTANACGPCTVRIFDGCSAVTHTIRSTNGQWVEEYHSGAGVEGDGVVAAYAGGCPASFVAPDRHPSFTGGDLLTGISGEFRISQRFGASGCNGSNYAARDDWDSALAICNQFSAAECLPSSAPGRLVGSCFEAPLICSQCGECTVDVSDYANWVNFSLGHHSTISPSSWIAYAIYLSKTYVHETTVEKWTC